MKDGVRLKNESGLKIDITNAGVETDRNYTCIPFNQVCIMKYSVIKNDCHKSFMIPTLLCIFNQVGKGSGSSVSVVVITKPTFVKQLPPHTGAPIERKQVGTN